MGQISVPIENGGPERLEVRWRRGWKDFVVRLDGLRIASFSGALASTGESIPLPDGSTLELRLFRGTPRGSVLEVKRDGISLAGETPFGDPEGQMRSAASWLYVIAVVNLILGVPFADALPLQLNVAISVYVVYVFALAGLGYFIGRGSIAAAVTAFIVFALGLAASTLLKSVEGIIINMLVLVALYRAIRKLREIRKVESL